MTLDELYYQEEEEEEYDPLEDYDYCGDDE